MTSDDDRLAPVTPLFGRTSGAGSAGEASPTGRPTVRRGGRRGRPEALQSPSSGADGVGWADADLLGPDETPASGPADGSPASESRPIEPFLPTYAAFAPREIPTIGSAAPVDAPRGLARVTAPVAFRGGDEDDSDDLDVESRDDAKARAENISLHALSRRGVSSHEMAKTLRSRDLPEEIVLEEVERLERVGLLNDVELAENLVQSKQDRKGLGKGAITAELRQRGIAQEAIDSAISDIDDDDEQARATEWAVKRAGQLRGLDQATAERRLSAFLMRRGYRSEVIRRALEEALPRGGARRSGVRFE
jgi:regulatory protein